MKAELLKFVQDPNLVKSLKDAQDIIVELIPYMDEDIEEHEVLQVLEDLVLVRSSLKHFKRDHEAGRKNYSISNIVQYTSVLKSLKKTQDIIVEALAAISEDRDDSDVTRILKNINLIHAILTNIKKELKGGSK